MTIELDPSKVSPQTHEFVSMFRPPWEPLIAHLNKVLEEHRVERSNRGLSGPEYNRGVPFIDCFGRTLIYDTEKLRAHYLAGHFDIPQYRVIEEAKQ